MTDPRDARPTFTTCPCPSCARMECDHRPELETAPGLAGALSAILHAISGHQAEPFVKAGPCGGALAAREAGQ